MQTMQPTVGVAERISHTIYFVSVGGGGGGLDDKQASETLTCRGFWVLGSGFGCGCFRFKYCSCLLYH